VLRGALGCPGEAVGLVSDSLSLAERAIKLAEWLDHVDLSYCGGGQQHAGALIRELLATTGRVELLFLLKAAQACLAEARDARADGLSTAQELERTARARIDTAIGLLEGSK
jgi:hypothetical protein